MRTWSTFLIAAPVAAGLLAAPAANAEWRDHRGGGWHGGGYNHGWHRDNGGEVAAGALAGIGIGALLGGAIASSQYRYYAPPPPVVYAPPPPYYGGPAYAVPPGYRY